MDMQQEIDLSEQELAELLGRVLAGPLAPLRESLKECGRQLAALEAQVLELREVAVPSIGDVYEERLEDLKRHLKSEADTSRRAFASKLDEALGVHRTALLSAQAAALGGLDESLRQHAVERSDSLALALTGRLEQSGLRQHDDVIELRDELSKQALQLGREAAAEMERRTAEVCQQLAELQADVRRLNESGAAMEHGLSERQAHLLRLHEESRAQVRDEIGAALRPVRRLLMGMLVLAAASVALLATVTAHGLVPLH